MVELETIQVGDLHIEVGSTIQISALGDDIHICGIAIEIVLLFLWGKQSHYHG